METIFSVKFESPTGRQMETRLKGEERLKEFVTNMSLRGYKNFIFRKVRSRWMERLPLIER